MHIMTPVLKASRRLFLEISSGTLFGIKLYIISIMYTDYLYLSTGYFIKKVLLATWALRDR